MIFIIVFWNDVRHSQYVGEDKIYDYWYVYIYLLFLYYTVISVVGGINDCSEILNAEWYVYHSVLSQKNGIVFAYAAKVFTTMLS